MSKAMTIWKATVFLKTVGGFYMQKKVSIFRDKEEDIIWSILPIPRAYTGYSKYIYDRNKFGEGYFSSICLSLYYKQ